VIAASHLQPLHRLWATLFSVVATVGQYALHQTAFLTPMMISRSPQFGATVLCVAGVIQLTRWKIRVFRDSGDMVRHPG
jgi:predicted metal-binding membrane protein